MNETKHLVASKQFYKLFLIVGGIWIVGGYNDMWAHAHVPELETFFTPWHAIFYAGFALMLLLFAGIMFLNHRKGHAWKHSLPQELHLSAIGLCIFLLGGLADMLWHTFLGIEKNFAIMISPPHMLIAIGGMLTTMGMLHGLWSNGKNPTHLSPWSVSIIITYVSLSFNYMFDYFNPFVFPYMMSSFAEGMLFYPQIGELVMNVRLSEILGIANMIIFTTFIMGTILMSIRYWKAPFGTFTVLFTLNITAVILAYTRHFWFILSAAVAGLLIDILYRQLTKETHHDHHKRLRVFGFFTPFILFSVMALTVVITDSSLWEFPMWGGSILVTSFLGFLMTYILIPPQNT